MPGGPGLPRLITIEDMRGDLHCHTTLSDGRQTLEQMVSAAQGRGLEYLAITDHSASHGFGDHVTPEALEERIEEIHALNAGLDDFEVLAGTEVNILPDGSLDYDDELLAELDWVIASVHTSFSMGEQEMTDRMIHGDRAPAGRRHRPPDGAQDRDATAVRARHRAGDRGGGADRHDARDQLGARPARSQRAGTRGRRPRRASAC